MQRKVKGIKSAPVGIRTPNLLIRSQVLYPIELRVPLRERKIKLFSLIVVRFHFFIFKKSTIAFRLI